MMIVHAVQERTAKAEALKQEGNSLYAEGKHAEAQVMLQPLNTIGANAQESSNTAGILQ
jgi:hypothetical protein